VYSQPIIPLALIYPLHKPLARAISFLVTDLSKELSLQITMKSSCHFLPNHLEYRPSRTRSSCPILFSNLCYSFNLAPFYRRDTDQLKTCVTYQKKPLSLLLRRRVYRALLPRNKTFGHSGNAFTKPLLGMGTHVRIFYGLKSISFYYITFPECLAPPEPSSR
jgi:hypothetical protein